MDNEIKTSPEEITSDDRLLGMLCHLSFFLGGILLPLIIWAVQKDKSKFVRFHSLQAIFFHITLGAIVIFFVMILLFILLLSGLSFGTFSNPGNGGGEQLPALMIVVLILFYGGIFLIIFGGMGYSVYLAVKTYQGNLIKIPFIGKIIYDRVFSGNVTH